MSLQFCTKTPATKTGVVYVVGPLNIQPLRVSVTNVMTIAGLNVNVAYKGAAAMTEPQPVLTISGWSAIIAGVLLTWILIVRGCV